MNPIRPLYVAQRGVEIVHSLEGVPIVLSECGFGIHLWNGEGGAEEGLDFLAG